MYRVSPFTYLVSAMLSTAVSGTDVVCESVELLHFNPPSNQTCQEYMSTYVQAVGGYISNPDATSECGFCSMSSTDTFLAAINSYFREAWRDFGLMWVYIAFNVAAAIFLYWLARVPKGSKRAKKE
jgi:ATP-binding cassette subfamily G (WHITE) protein 2 (PDR)